MPPPDTLLIEFLFWAAYLYVSVLYVAVFKETLTFYESSIVVLLRKYESGNSRYRGIGISCRRGTIVPHDTLPLLWHVS